MLIEQSCVRLREYENFWIEILLTNQRGLNNSHNF